MSRSVTCISSEPSAWVAYWGPDGNTALLSRLIGAGAQTQTGVGWGLGGRGGVGEPARLMCVPGGPMRAQIGSDEGGGCSATVAPDGGALTLACDPFGLHGVSHTKIGDTLWAASDPRLLRNLPGVSCDLSPDALHGYLCFSHVPTPLTAAMGVSALPAGHRLTVTAGRTEEVCGPAWREREPSPLDGDALAWELRGLLRAAVTRRLENEHDVGVFLSGGLDSSLVAALLAEAGARVHLFTLDFGPPFDIELPHARQVAAHLKRPLHVVPARPADIRGALEATSAAMRQPFGDGVVVPLYLLGRAARAHGLDTVFNGEGGDQLFSGWANKPMIAAELYRPAGGDLEAEREAAYLATYHRFWGHTQQLYTAQARAAVAGVDAGAWVRPALTADGFPQPPAPAAGRQPAAQGGAEHRAARRPARRGARPASPDAVLRPGAHGLDFRPAFRMVPARRVREVRPGSGPPRHSCPPRSSGARSGGMGVPDDRVVPGSPAPGGRALAFAPAAEAGRPVRPRRRRPPAARRGPGPGEFRRRRVGEKLWTLLMFHVWRETHP